MSGFKRTLGAFEALTLSIAIIAPTLAMAFNVALAAGAAGAATPLSFLIGGATMAVIALSFVGFSRRIASAGSAYAYVESVFGPRLGFLAGWALLLAYLCFLISATGLVGGFLAVALDHLGIGTAWLWLAIALAAALLVIRLGGREIRQVTTIMLVIETVAVLAILALAFVILTKVPLTSAPFAPDPAHGWSGVGYGVVFAVLSVAGFEGAATVAEETRDPHRAIPIAIVGSVLVATVLYTLVSYAQVLGFGVDRVGDLAKAPAPLDVLSARFISNGFGIFLDIAAGISSLACALGTASAAARILFALARGGLGERRFGRGLAGVDAAHGVPRKAVMVVGLCNVAALALFGSWTGFRPYSEAFATIATLVLMLVYIAVAAAQGLDAARRGRPAWSACGALGAVLLLWPLANSLVPVPEWPANLWPFIVLAWMAAGTLLSFGSSTAARDASA